VSKAKLGCCVDRDAGYDTGCTSETCMQLPDGKTCTIERMAAERDAAEHQIAETRAKLEEAAQRLLDNAVRMRDDAEWIDVAQRVMKAQLDKRAELESLLVAATRFELGDHIVERDDDMGKERWRVSVVDKYGEYAFAHLDTRDAAIARARELAGAAGEEGER